jgi:outer membrane protein OmpA-like peptidoglycan-associated protein
MTPNRRHSPVLLLAIAAPWLASCASANATEAPANLPNAQAEAPMVSTPRTASVSPAMNLSPVFRPDGASARERSPLFANYRPLKSSKQLEGSASAVREGPQESVDHVAPSGTNAPFVFSERRASEALDQLAQLTAIRREKRGAVMTLLCDRLVEPGQWTLTASGQFALNELAPGLRNQDARMIVIQAYTDSLGSSAVNDALSLRRAEAVRDHLILQGVSAERLRAEGLGSKRPVSGNATPEGRTQNRRIEIVIAPLVVEGVERAARRE